MRSHSWGMTFSRPLRKASEALFGWKLSLKWATLWMYSRRLLVVTGLSLPLATSSTYTKDNASYLTEDVCIITTPPAGQACRIMSDGLQAELPVQEQSVRHIARS